MTVISRSLIGLAAISALAIGGFGAASAAPAPHSSSAPRTSACTSVATTLGQSQGAAGSTFQTIRFTNKGSSSCTLSGYPGVSYVNVNKIMIGWPALDQSSLTGRAVPPNVVVAPGQTVTSVMQIPDYGNFSPVDCIAVNASSVRVIIAGTTTYLPWNQTECTTKYARSFIGPVTS